MLVKISLLSTQTVNSFHGHSYNLHSVIILSDRPPARMAVRMPTPINQFKKKDESIAVQMIFLDVYTWN